MTTPAPPYSPPLNTTQWPYNNHTWGIYFPTVPYAFMFFDIATVLSILCFLFFSFLSLIFIMIIHLKSRYSNHLRSFSSHSTARFIMIILICLWSINEVLRLPMFRKRFIFPFIPPAAVQHQTHFCKFHLILSFGLFEPGFLVSLLFLVNISIKKRALNDLWTLGFVGIACLPIMIALFLAVYILPGKITILPPVFYRSYVILDEKKSLAEVVFCTYPLLGNVIFTMFGVAYALAFSLSCCKVMELAINKRLKARVNTLACTVVCCLTVQIVMLTASLFWDPESVKFYTVIMVNFMCVLGIGVVGETIMVIMPIHDALRVGDDDDRWYRIV